MQHIASLVEKTTELRGANFYQNVAVKDVDVPCEVDMLLTWPDPEERIVIEWTRLRSSSNFFSKVAQLLQLRKPLIFAVVAKDELSHKLTADIARLQALNTNVNVIVLAEAGEDSSSLASGSGGDPVKGDNSARGLY